jgi:hypothetical protein
MLWWHTLEIPKIKEVNRQMVRKCVTCKQPAENKERKATFFSGVWNNSLGLDL